MARKLTILIDMDSVVVDLMTPWFAAHNAATGDSFTVEKATDWGVHKLQPYGARIFEPLSAPGFYERLRFLPGAESAIELLRLRGHRVVLLSYAPNAESAKGKVAWVAQNLPSLPERDLILTGAKELVLGDVLLDDGPDNVVGYRAAHPFALIATIRYPYSTPQQLEAADFVAGDYRSPALAWSNFVAWVDELSFEG